MSTEKLRLVIDGVDLTDDYDRLEMATPAMVHDIPRSEGAACRVLGPRSFTILIADPSDRLYALVDGGVAVHEVKVIAEWAAALSITHPVHFHMGWAEVGGTRWMFGSLAPDREREAKWVEESPAAAGEPDRKA